MRSQSDALEHHRAAVLARVLEADPRRAGSDSVSWKLNREIVVLAGWGRAVLLQLAHPAIASAVNDHSGFRDGLRAGVRRMHSTVSAMLSITFGDEEHMIAAAARINAIHSRVHGPGYSAQNPELQRWVHATLLDSTLDVYERLVGPVTPDERDRYCAEASIMEPLLGMPRGVLPRTAAELTGYMAGMVTGGRVTVTDTSRVLANAVLRPPWWFAAWPAFRPLWLLTIGSLPPRIRRAYGFEWRARDERALTRWTFAIRTLLRLLPRSAREWPIARYRTTATANPSYPLSPTV